MMDKYCITAFILTILLTAQTPLFAQQQPSTEDDSDEPLAAQLAEMLKSEVFNLSLLIQTQATSTFSDDNFNGGHAFGLGAIRMDIRGVADRRFIYRLQADLTREPVIMDAQVGYLISDNMSIVAGAFKPFLSRDLDPGPGDTDFLDRARHVGTMMNSREIGITLLGEPGNLNYRLGIYNGSALTGDNDNRFLYTGRLGYEHDFGDFIFSAGFNGAYDRSRYIWVGNSGLNSLGNRRLYGGFAGFDSSRLFGTFELLQTRFDAVELGGREEIITGFYGTIGGRINTKSELLIRYDHLSFDLIGKRPDLLIFGWNYQATSLFSTVVNLLMQQNDQFGLAAQFQFQF